MELVLAGIFFRLVGYSSQNEESHIMVIVNEECDYIVKNIKPISTLLESYDVAKYRVPTYVRSEMARAIGRRIKELPFYKNNQWKIEEADDDLPITPTMFFNDDIEIGIFYGIEGFTWDSLLAKDREDGPWIYLFYRVPEKSPKNKKQKIQNWKKTILEVTENNKPKLLEKYHVFPDDEDQNYLVAYFLNDILNINTIGKDFKGAIKDTIDVLIELMEHTKEFMITPP